VPSAFLTRMSVSNQAGLALSVLAAVILVCLVPGTVVAQKIYSPSHPEVVEMIDRGVQYLRPFAERDLRPKEQAIVGLAIFNAVQDAGDPAVVRALDIVSAHIAEKDMTVADGNEFSTIYYPCVAMIFMAEVDHNRYASQIDKIIAWLVDRQDEWGGWGYFERRASDISQAQYGCLALWLANFKGFKIPGKAAADAAAFFAASQNADGSWYYQVLGPQANLGGTTIYASRVAAGASSCYALSNLLELDRSQLKSRLVKMSAEKIEELPPSVVEVFEGREEAAVGGLDGVEYNKGRLDNAKSKADRWFAANYKVDTEFWNYYFHYGYERYVTFYELQNGPIPHQQDWYDRGVRYMKQQQLGNGAWPNETSLAPEATEAINTAFAILYLTRSTRNIIGQPIGGALEVGEKLPDPTDGPLKLDDQGRVVQSSVERSVSDLVSSIDSADSEQLERLLQGVESLNIFDEGSDESRNEKLAKLKGAINHENWKVRQLVAKFLAKQRQIDNAPALIYALSDPDVRVAEIAHEGLKKLSRKIDSIKVNESEDEQAMLAEYKAAKEKWEKWYLKLRPTGQLFDN
jgi:hypothetical protein